MHKWKSVLEKRNINFTGNLRQKRSANPGPEDKI